MRGHAHYKNIRINEYRTVKEMQRFNNAFRLFGMLYDFIGFNIFVNRDYWFPRAIFNRFSW